ncbi:glucose PTS transporter subunit IIA [Corynebacterium sp. TAE3-ERU12]|nr:glucose PTS transporter subunit IIA [Corynebacterium sp. TAE3-ERU12]
MADTAKTSRFILEHLGGADNIASMTHCATRLRFQLHDQSKADTDALDSNPEVMGVVPQGSTGLQVIMGGGVAEYYGELRKQPGMGDDDRRAAGKEYGGVRSKYGWVDYSFEFLSDTFRPILWALLGASLIITLLVLCDTFGIQDFRAEDQPPTFAFMHAMWQSVFYFLPVMVGACAARKLGANEWVGAAIPCALLTPTFIDMGEPGDIVQVFGLPMVLNGYSGQVFPPLIAAIALFWVEKGLKKIIPSAVHMVFVPFFSLLILIPLTAFVFGPFGIGIGNGISTLLLNINEFSPFILAIIVPLLYPFLVPLGLHWPLNAIMIQNIATLGYDIIQGPMGAWNFACFGVVTGAFIISLRDHDKQMRQVSFGGMMAGLLGGISEPSLYGVLLRFRKSYLRLLPGCLAGGIVMGIFNVKANAFVFTSLLTIPPMDPMGGYAIGLSVAFFTSMLLVVFFDYRTADERAEVLARLAAEKDAETTNTDTAAVAGAGAAAGAGAGAAATKAEPATTSVAVLDAVAVESPLQGRLIALSEVPDPAFAAGKVGRGAAIDPTGDTVVAPCAAKVMAAFPTGHAIGLKLEGGVQLLIHIGVDTVNMDGEGFELLVAKGDEVEAGTPLVRFNREAIVAAGYSPITPVLVTNYRKFGDINVIAEGDNIAAGDRLLEVNAKPES